MLVAAIFQTTRASCFGYVLLWYWMYHMSQTDRQSFLELLARLKAFNNLYFVSPLHIVNST